MLIQAVNVIEDAYRDLPSSERWPDDLDELVAEKVSRDEQEESQEQHRDQLSQANDRGSGTDEEE